jgi:hypothetical protein
VSFQGGSKLSIIEPNAFYQCIRLGPSIQLPSSLKVIPMNCFAYCDILSEITLDQNASLAEIQGEAFDSCPLTSFRIPYSCERVNWTCFSFPIGDTESLSSAVQGIKITFESPVHIRRIYEFHPGKATEVEMPDSLEVLTVARGGHQGLVCRFGRDSRLAYLRVSDSQARWFVQWSTSSLKPIRSENEWIGPNEWIEPSERVDLQPSCLISFVSHLASCLDVFLLSHLSRFQYYRPNWRVSEAVSAHSASLSVLFAWIFER